MCGHARYAAIGDVGDGHYEATVAAEKAKIAAAKEELALRDRTTVEVWDRNCSTVTYKAYSADVSDTGQLRVFARTGAIIAGYASGEWIRFEVRTAPEQNEEKALDAS